MRFASLIADDSVCMLIDSFTYGLNLYDDKRGRKNGWAPIASVSLWLNESIVLQWRVLSDVNPSASILPCVEVACDKTAQNKCVEH